MNLSSAMPVMEYKFYECDNPGCRMRFPGYGGYPRWNRCPVCRSGIHVVATVTNADEVVKQNEDKPACGIEALLDNIRSAWNVGSIFRTADGTGIRKLYLCGITPTPENLKVAKTALGAEGSILWEQAKNGVRLAGELKARGYVLWALEDIPGAIPLFQMVTGDMKSPLVLVVGNELTGVDPGIISLCDEVISIPMRGKKQSYNVAVAFGIATSFLLYRQIFSQGSRKTLPNT